jgi:lantibiotic modifying enzyme
MHAALTMHEWTGEARWAELFRADAGDLWHALLPISEAPCRMWTQDLWGRKQKMTGAGHGFAGNASALIRGRALLPTTTWAQWADAIIETAYATAQREGPLANWVPEVPPAHMPPKFLVQWCHGAPGMVTSLARLPDARLDELIAAAAELTWVAGPLEKGAGLCHGTAGNGYAFLKLLARTHDERWLERARAFAMHAMAQCDRMAIEHGQRRHSLWTGDAGVALYAWSCIEGDDALPNLDPAS